VLLFAYLLEEIVKSAADKRKFSLLLLNNESCSERVDSLQDEIQRTTEDKNYFKNHYRWIVFSLMTCGPLPKPPAKPRWFDCFLGYRTTPEWKHQVKLLLRAMQQLSDRERSYFHGIAEMSQYYLPPEKDENLVPESYLSNPVFEESLKRIMSCHDFHKSLGPDYEQWVLRVMTIEGNRRWVWFCWIT